MRVEGRQKLRTVRFPQLDALILHQAAYHRPHTSTATAFGRFFYAYRLHQNKPPRAAFSFSGVCMSETKDAPSRASMEERLKAGDRRFSRLEARIDKSDREVRGHLQQQDDKIDAIVTAVARIDANTSSIVETWNEGAKAVRFFCRLAQAWRFLVRQVAIPVVLPGISIYALWHYAHYKAFPTWISDVYKLLIAIL